MQSASTLYIYSRSGCIRHMHRMTLSWGLLHGCVVTQGEYNHALSSHKTANSYLTYYKIHVLFLPDIYNYNSCCHWISVQLCAPSTLFNSASKRDSDQMSTATIMLARVLLLLLFVAMGPAHVSGSITKCASGCGTQNNYEYIDYCTGEDDIVTNMLGEKWVWDIWQYTRLPKVYTCIIIIKYTQRGKTYIYISEVLHVYASVGKPLDSGAGIIVVYNI